MKIIRTHLEDPKSLTEFERDQVYNGLDVLVTYDVFNALHPQLDNHTAATYAFSRALQAPTLEMRARGVLVDAARKSEVIEEYFAKMDIVERNLEKIILDGVGMDSFNWRSHHDLQRLFYHELNLPVQRKQGRPTTDRGAREKLGQHPIATQIVAHINLLADLGKKISVLKTSEDEDGRIRTSYNIAGTNTGRFSSSLSEFGTGGNLQNVEESLRSIFVSDPGFKFAKCDAKSGESFCVGAVEWNLFNDSRYLDACETGDPHTAAARLVWPNLPWTGDLKRDKDIAEKPFYRQNTYRFMCKKLGHGSNYGGKPETLAQQANLDVPIVVEFQKKYFESFPSHRLWQHHVEQTLRSDGYLVSLMGRKRYFFGRRTDPDTLRGAIAFDPQSSLADIVNEAMLKIWRLGYVIIAMHDHDALTFMYPEKDEAKIIPRLMADLIVPVELANGRTLRIPYDCQTGWNKGKYNEKTNPNGLKDYYGSDNRKRVKEAGLLDRVVHRSARKSRYAKTLPPMDGEFDNSGDLGTESLDEEPDTSLL
jgi:DNA polymerase-1